jgi:hypothetical protein
MRRLQTTVTLGDCRGSLNPIHTRRRRESVSWREKKRDRAGWPDGPLVSVISIRQANPTNGPRHGQQRRERKREKSF